MKRIRNNQLAAALGILALGLAAGPAAQACSLTAWTANTGAPVAGGVADGIATKSGVCALKAASPGPSYVTESTNHGAGGQPEGGTAPFHGRFFVYTGMTGASPVVFRALTTDGGSTSAIDIAYNAATANFTFTVNGASQSTAANSAPNNTWSQVQFTYQQGAAFTASTRRLGVDYALPAGLTAGAGVTVEAVQLGVVANGGANGSIIVDEYEASRAAGTPTFTARVRCDANNDGGVSGPDIVQVVNQAANGVAALAVGQPDCNEDGGVSGPDIIAVVNLAAGNGTP